jgi:DNA-binding transcriptional regulator LsrR (DeoR family)
MENNAEHDYEEARLISQVLTLYYLENVTQSEIGKMLDVSTAKVNRLLKLARKQGLVEINIKIPLQHIYELERQLETITNVQKAIVVPIFSSNPQSILQSVGRAAADFLLDHLRDGDTICMGGGLNLDAMVQSITPNRNYNVSIFPAIGGVQGRNETDVNNLVDQLAKKLGGRSFQLHAPAFTDSVQERDALLNLRQIKEILDSARRAQIAVFGIGKLDKENSSYFRFTSLPSHDFQKILEEKAGVGEVLAHVINAKGEPCAPDYASRVVGINIDDLRSIPLTIGVAALESKALPIAAALKGSLVKTIVMDEQTARKVLSLF